MGYATGLLEYSDDPLSDSTPTYIDRSSYVLGDVTWSDGKNRDLDDPQAGTISFRLSNANGEWVPNSADSLYPDSPFLLRRFRWSVNGTAEGVWYVSDWQITYPAGTPYSEVVVTAVDGFELLSLDALDLLDPPTATSYEEVVMHDQPFLYARLGETVSSAVPVVAGPDGVYQIQSQIMLGQAGAIVGDPDTAARFNDITSTRGRARFPLSATENVNDTDALTLECWFKKTPFAADPQIFVVGPNGSAGQPIWKLAGNHLAAADLEFGVYAGAAYCIFSYNDPGGLDDDVWYHFAATYGGRSARLYLNGQEVAATRSGADAPATILPGVANSFVYVGADVTNATGSITTYIDEPAVYEHVLSPERILAHYNAGVQGFAEELAGERVANVADSPLWAETEIEAGEHMVHPVMAHGQSKLDEIRAAVKAEMPDTHFFFGGDGNPVYRAWNYNDGTGVLCTFGPGGISYQGLEPVYDSEMFNEVTVGHESAPGEETQHTETDATSEGQFFRRAHSETGLILSEHHDAIAVAAAILEKFKDPQRRFASLTLNGAQAAARTQILGRQIGDLIRVVGIGVNDADIVTTILGRSKTLTAAGHLTCTWTLARGFDAAAGLWQLGIDGFSELGETTVLG